MIDQSFLDDQRELLGAAQIDKLHHLLGETSARLIDDITRAAATGDQTQLARSAHQLGNAASALDLVRLFERSRDVELAAAAMAPTDLEGAARELAELQQASVQALNDLLEPADQRSVS